MTATSNEPRAITAEEARAIFLDAIRTYIDYWANNPAVADRTHQRRLEGFAHSLLCVIDGVSSAMPCSMDLVLSPHPDDKQFNIDQGENWIEAGMVINDCHLHELLYRKDGA
jgi:hypothetical protein